ncbi:DUF4369 domain-containing protein [Mucilaginibacter psychrotolerans]|nr:DUF4369 domain-containing protein [Mucilaginibacter psychrotolerans]
MKFNKLFFAALLLIPAVLSTSTAKAQQSFTINGQLSKNQQGMVFMMYDKNGKRITDSADVVNGAFKITGSITDPSYGFIVLNPKRDPSNPMALQINDARDIFVEPGSFSLKGDSVIAKATIDGGGPTQQAMNNYKNELKPLLDAHYASSQKIFDYRNQKENPEYLNALKQSKDVNDKIKAYDSVYINTHPENYFAFFLWSKYNRASSVTSKSEPAFNRFSDRVKNSAEGRIIAGKIDADKRLAPGKLAPDFTLSDSSGKKVSLSSFRGKNVMLLFWFPNFMGFSDFDFNIGRISRRLRDKNFVLVSVFYNVRENDDLYKWKSVIRSGGFQNCVNLQDIGGLPSEGNSGVVAKSYALTESRMLPVAMLIGPDGKIISNKLKLLDTELALDIEKQLK